MKRIIPTVIFISKLLLGMASAVLLITVFLIMTKIESAPFGGEIYRLQNDGLSYKAGDYLVIKNDYRDSETIVYISEEMENAGTVCIGNYLGTETSGEEQQILVMTDDGKKNVSQTAFLGFFIKKASVMTITVTIISSLWFYIIFVILPGVVLIFGTKYMKKKYGNLTDDEIRELQKLGFDPEDKELQRLIGLYGDEIIEGLKTVEK